MNKDLKELNKGGRREVSEDTRAIIQVRGSGGLNQNEDDSGGKKWLDYEYTLKESQKDLLKDLVQH